MACSTFPRTAKETGQALLGPTGCFSSPSPACKLRAPNSFAKQEALAGGPVRLCEGAYLSAPRLQLL